MARPPARRVAVVGGGIAGLTLAVALADDVDVVVHEAQPERWTTGSSLVLWPSAARALARLGALGPGDTTPVGPARLFDVTGRPLTRAHRSGLLGVLRPRLLDRLVAALPPRVRVVTDEVADPAALDADLVVGADGVRSRVRGLVAPGAAERRSTPYVVLRGRTAAPPDPGLVGEYWGPGLLFGLVPSAAGGYWFTTHRSDAGPEPLDVDAVRAEAGRAFAGAAPVVHAALADRGATATRIWVAPPLRRYVRGRYVVVGDAAHAMTPNLGRGACDAVLDAASLAAAVRRGRPLGGWEASRLLRTQADRAASGAVMRLALLGRGHGLRDAALRLTDGVVRPGGRG